MQHAVVTPDMEGVPGKIRLFKGLSDLFDRHAMVGQTQGLVVDVFVDIPLFEHERLHLRLSPDRPVVRIDQRLRPIPEPGQRLIDHPSPQARIADFGTARGQQVVLGLGADFGHAQHAVIGQEKGELGRGFGARAHEKLEGDPVDADRAVPVADLDRSARGKPRWPRATVLPIPPSTSPSGPNGRASPN